MRTEKGLSENPRVASLAMTRRTAAGLLTSLLLAPGCATAFPLDLWRAFQDQFVAEDGRVVDTGNGGISHSEGQGYALLMAHGARDRDAFDTILGWAQRSLLRTDTALFSWRYDPRINPPVSDPNNASDGDILIAWALLLAAETWREPAYALQSEDIRAAILRDLVIDYSGQRLLLPGLQGFVRDTSIVVNPSYYVWPALDAFEQADPGLWAPLIEDGLNILARARFGQQQLVPDWLEIAAEGAVQPANGWPPRFGFDAVRVPLYLVWSGRFDESAPFRDYWKAGPQPAWVDVVTGATATFAATPGMEAVRALTIGQPQPKASAGDYYSHVLAGLSRLAAV